MKLIRQFGMVGLLGACWLVAAGCGDDDAKKSVSDGGSGGRGGAGGKGLGGSSNKAGTTGKAGTPNRGGASQGGEGGSAVGGEGPGGEGGLAGEGGAAGSGGAGGDVAAPVAKKCAYSCVGDADCAGIDKGAKCHPTRKRCENPDAQCAAHSDCLAKASGWNLPCLGDTDCAAGDEACVAFKGEGRCAALPNADLGCLIAASDTEPAVQTRFGGIATTVSVCTSIHGRCAAGECITGCSAGSGACSADSGLTCNAQTGVCGCTMDTQCAADGVSVCGATSVCECAVPTDCTGAGRDTCVSGTCGCSNADSCPTSSFFNAPKVCE